ncbi:MAG: helix-turn-helix transcriptional regulator [Clostridiales bacterium]|nr:helix-turn-helix transcriptional regulator [Clostridiales bacterium]
MSDNVIEGKNDNDVSNKIHYEALRDSSAAPVLVSCSRLFPEQHHHYHNSIEVIYVKSGNIGMGADFKTTITISAGEIFVLDEMILHRTSSYTENGEYYIIMIPVYEIEDFLRLRGDRYFGEYKCEDKDGTIFAMVREIFNINDRMAEDDMPEYRRFLLNTMLTGIFMRTGSRPRSESPSFEFQPILEYIHAHIHERFTIKDLAARFGYTPRGISDLVDRISLDCGLKEYIARIRAAKAKQLLCAGSSCEEAAKASGYGCIRSFYNAFEKLEHMTPGEWLSENKSLQNIT